MTTNMPKLIKEIGKHVKRRSDEPDGKGKDSQQTKHSIFMAITVLWVKDERRLPQRCVRTIDTNITF